MSKGGGQVSGYRYYFSILMGLCRGPIDQLVAIRVGDIECWPGLSDGSHPSSTPEYLAGLFNPGAAGPPGGYYDDSGGPVDTNAQFSINAPNLFGGDTAEGGIIGNVTMMMGARDQTIPSYVRGTIAGGSSGFNYTYPTGGGVGVDETGLDANGVVAVDGTGKQIYADDGGTGSTTEIASDISCFRGLATIWYDGQVCSNNPYPKTWKMRMRRAVAI